MKLVNVLDSELREEALRRWKIAKKLAKRIDGTIHGSIAAMVTEGLPRLPRDADIVVNWSLDEFMEWFEIFEGEPWRRVILGRTDEDTQRNGGPRYGFVLVADGGFSINIVGLKMDPNRVMDGAKIFFEKSKYVSDKISKIRGRKKANVLDLLDLQYFGEDIKDVIKLIPKSAYSKLLRETYDFTTLIPRENQWFLEFLRKYVGEKVDS